MLKSPATVSQEYHVHHELSFSSSKRRRPSHWWLLTDWILNVSAKETPNLTLTLQQEKIQHTQSLQVWNIKNI